MAESDKDRETLAEQFWNDVDHLSLQEQESIRAELTRTFIRLPQLLEELYLKVDAEKIA